MNMVIDQWKSGFHQLSNHCIPLFINLRSDLFTYGKPLNPDILIVCGTARIVCLKGNRSFTKAYPFTTLRPPGILRFNIFIYLNIVHEYFDMISGYPDTHLKPFVVICQGIVYIAHIINTCCLSPFRILF